MICNAYWAQGRLLVESNSTDSVVEGWPDGWAVFSLGILCERHNKGRERERERKQSSTLTVALLNLRMPLLESPCLFSPPSALTLHSAVTSRIKLSISFAGSDISTSAAKTLQDDLQLGDFFWWHNQREPTTYFGQCMGLALKRAKAAREGDQHGRCNCWCWGRTVR